MDTVFVDGVHYELMVVDTDADGNELTGANMENPLTWVDGTFVPRKENDPLHNEVHGTRMLTELIPGSE